MAAVTGKFLKFDGVNDKVTFPDNAAYDVTAAISFVFTFMRDVENGASPLLFRNASYRVDLTARDTIEVTISGIAEPFIFTKGFPVQYWHQVGISVYEVDGTYTAVAFYYEGQHYQTGIKEGQLPAGNANVLILGNDGATSWFKGRMTKFYATTDILTAAEHLAIYNLGLNIQDAATVDNHIIIAPFDDGSGTSVTDDGSNNITGTIAGSAVWATGPGLYTKTRFMRSSDVNDQWFGVITLDTIEWVGPTTIAHAMKVTDWKDGEIVGGVCAVANDGGGQKYIGKVVDGLKVTALTSGYLLISYC